MAEVARVLRASGRLVLLAHVASRHRLLRAAQRGIERVAATRAVDAQTRLVVPLMSEAGLSVAHCSRSREGIIERVIATKR